MNRGRKVTGGKYHKFKKKKLYETKNQERKVVIGETKAKKIKTLGGHKKTILLKSDTANVFTGKEVKTAKIINVIQTPQNSFFARENRLIKSAIIETSLGKARITNRPSQEGQVNAVLIKE